MIASSCLLFATREACCPTILAHSLRGLPRFLMYLSVRGVKDPPQNIELLVTLASSSLAILPYSCNCCKSNPTQFPLTLVQGVPT